MIVHWSSGKLPVCGTLLRMGQENPLEAEQAKELADELSALSKEQSEALQVAIYIPLSKEQARAYDRRAKRIGKICGLLGNFKPK